MKNNVDGENVQELEIEVLGSVLLPLVAPRGHAIDPGDVDTGGTGASLEVDDHAMVGSEHSRTAIAVDRWAEVGNPVLGESVLNFRICYSAN